MRRSVGVWLGHLLVTSSVALAHGCASGANARDAPANAEREDEAIAAQKAGDGEPLSLAERACANLAVVAPREGADDTPESRRKCAELMADMASECEAAVECFAAAATPDGAERCVELLLACSTGAIQHPLFGMFPADPAQLSLCSEVAIGAPMADQRAHLPAGLLEPGGVEATLFADAPSPDVRVSVVAGVDTAGVERALGCELKLGNVAEGLDDVLDLAWGFNDGISVSEMAWFVGTHGTRAHLEQTPDRGAVLTVSAYVPLERWLSAFGGPGGDALVGRPLAEVEAAHSVLEVDGVMAIVGPPTEFHDTESVVWLEVVDGVVVEASSVLDRPTWSTSVEVPQLFSAALGDADVRDGAYVYAHGVSLQAVGDEPTPALRWRVRRTDADTPDAESP